MNHTGQRSALRPPASSQDEQLLTVLAFATVLGMLVGLVLCAIWKYHPELLSGGLEYFALTVCPSFLLVSVLGTFDSTFALVMTVGTLVFANGFLYAGCAAGLYFVLTRILLRRRARR